MVAVPTAKALVLSGALLAGACSSAADEETAACRLEEAEGVRIDDGLIELQPDASGKLADTARLGSSFAGDAFGYVEGYHDDEGLDVRIIDGTLIVTVLPASSQWYGDEAMGIVRAWERSAPDCGRFATLKMLSLAE
jgi:hypothetical protein